MNYETKLYSILTDKTISKKEIIMFIMNRKIKLDTVRNVNSEIIRNFDRINWYKLPSRKDCKKENHPNCICYSSIARPSFPF